MATLSDSEEHSKFQQVKEQAAKSLRAFEVLNNRRNLDLLIDRDDKALPEDSKSPTKQEAEDSTKVNLEDDSYKT